MFRPLRSIREQYLVDRRANAKQTMKGNTRQEESRGSQQKRGSRGIREDGRRGQRHENIRNRNPKEPIRMDALVRDAQGVLVGAQGVHVLRWGLNYILGGTCPIGFQADRETFLLFIHPFH